MNSDLSLMPGSCLKIVTTAAALHLLGPNYQFETHLEYDGFVDQAKILHGNIYIRGGGDPCLGSDRTAGSLHWQKQIEVWADAIQKLGIAKIQGKVLGDGTKWERAMAVPSWGWEDLGNYYGAGGCALSFHENFYSLFFEPGSAVGENASILRTDPPMSSLILHNEIKTGPEGSGDCACIYGSEFSPLQHLRGTVPAGVKEFAIKGSIPDPILYCADLLTRELQARGIAVDGDDASYTNHTTNIHTTRSPPLQEIVYWTNQKSINLYAEHLCKKIGEITANQGSTVAGVQAIGHFLESQGINLDGMNIADGSGLSRKNLITTRQLVKVLIKMRQSTLFPIFLESLPQKNTLIRAKSGSLSLVRGYAGYAGNIAFAILINNSSDHQLMNEKINFLIEELNELYNNTITN